MQSAHATHPVARDSKITTFPGLYVAGVAFARAVGLVTGAGADAPAAAVCNPSVLRSINLCFGLGTLVLLFCLLRRRMPAGKAGAQALQLALYPPHFFFTFLYYTDVASLFWVLLTVVLTTTGGGAGKSGGAPSLARVLGGSITGSVAIFFRQTNVVWLLFCFGTAALAELESDPARFERLGNGRELSFRVLGNFVTALVAGAPRLLAKLGALLLPVVAFVVFVVLNGSIVVGDKEHHQAVLHWAQLA